MVLARSRAACQDGHHRKQRAAHQLSGLTIATIQSRAACFVPRISTHLHEACSETAGLDIDGSSVLTLGAALSPILRRRGTDLRARKVGRTAIGKTMIS